MREESRSPRGRTLHPGEVVAAHGALVGNNKQAAFPVWAGSDVSCHHDYLPDLQGSLRKEAGVCVCVCVCVCKPKKRKWKMYQRDSQRGNGF